MAWLGLTTECTPRAVIDVLGAEDPPSYTQSQAIPWVDTEDGGTTSTPWKVWKATNIYIGKASRVQSATNGLKARCDEY